MPAYSRLPVNVVGEYYTSRSLPLSAQTTINLYPEVNPSGRTVTALQNWPGAKLWISGVGADRGLAIYKNVLYQVTGTNLISINSVGVKTTIGTIPGLGRCLFANDGTNLIIVTGGNVYQYNGVALTTVTDPDLENPDSVDILNNQVIYDGNDGRWVVASPADPDNVPDINYAAAESQGDDLIRVYVFNQTLYLMGSDSIESWFNSGSGSPPFTRIEGGIIEDTGIISVYAVTNTPNYVYFINNNKTIVRMSGYQIDSTITPPATAHQLSKLDCSDAVGYSIEMEGQWLVIFTFPTSGQTWMYSETFGAWAQLSFGANGGRHLMNSYINIYDRHLITDYRNGNIYELDFDTFTDNSDVQLKERTFGPINGNALNLPGSVFIIEYFEVFIQTGVGSPTGQGKTPDIIFSISVDGGRTFDSSAVGYVSMGEGGDYLIRVRYDCVIEFQELFIKMRITDPAYVSIHGGFVSVKPDEGY